MTWAIFSLQYFHCNIFICSICVHLYSFVYMFCTRVFLCMWMRTRIATGVVIWWTIIMTVCMIRARTIAKQEQRWMAYFDETINIFVRFFVCNSQKCFTFVCRSLITQIAFFFCTTKNVFLHDNQYLGTIIHISVRWLGYVDETVNICWRDCQHRRMTYVFLVNQRPSIFEYDNPHFCTLVCLFWRDHLNFRSWLAHIVGDLHTQTWVV